MPPNDALPKVNEPSEAYRRMVPNWALVDALHSGTPGMRKAGELYMPKEPKETPEGYSIRLERAVLYPGLQRALRNFVGKAFANSISFKDTTPEWDEWLANIDLSGNSIQKFAETVFHSALKYGHTSVLSEYPTISASATLYDERQVIQARPYLCHREAKSLIGWRTQTVNFREVLTRVRIQEEYTEYADQWDDDGELHQIRVLEPGLWSLYRENADGQWLLVDQGVTSLDVIPLTPIYCDMLDTLQSRVPMLDLAWTNVSHWQSYSDQRNILRIARVPMVFVSGATEADLGGQLVIGPNRFIALANPQANMRFVEHSGAAIVAGRQDCLDLEDRMNAMAAEALMSKPGTETATGRAIDARDATSPLAVWVQTFEQSMNRAFELMAMYGGADKSPVMQMTRDFGILGNTSDLDALYKARVSREISRETFLKELQRRGVLSENFDMEADQALLDAEPPEPPAAGGFGTGTGAEPAGGARMATLNELLADLLRARAISLARYDAGLQAKAVKVLRQLERELAARVADLDFHGELTVAARAQMEAIIQWSRATIEGTYRKLDAGLIQELRDLAAVESRWITQRFNGAINVSFLDTAASPQMLAEIVANSMVRGNPAEDWWAGQARGLANRFAAEMRLGMTQGETVGQLVQRVRGTHGGRGAVVHPGVMEASYRDARALVRTSVQTVANNARLATYEANGDVIDKLRYASMLHDRTMPVCQARDGLQWDMATKKPIGHDLKFEMPPLHWNCRSTMVPVTMTWREMGFDVDELEPAQRAAMNGVAPADMTYEEWLRAQPATRQDKILGHDKADMFRRGYINLRDTIDQSGRPLTLEQIEEAL